MTSFFVFPSPVDFFRRNFQEKISKKISFFSYNTVDCARVKKTLIQVVKFSMLWKEYYDKVLALDLKPDNYKPE